MVENWTFHLQESKETEDQAAWSELQPVFGVAGPRVFDANPKGKISSFLG